jgi:hypothetical protein
MERIMQARAERDLDVLTTKLRRAQADYQRARSLGDSERICRFQIQINALTVERDRLIKYLLKAESGDSAVAA